MSPFDKIGPRYIGEASCKENENAYPIKSVEEREISIHPVMKVEQKCSR
jgi:hypothetical protein